MDLLTELTRTAHDPAVIAQVRVLLDQAEKAKQLLAQNDAKLAQHDARLKEKDFKITALRPGISIQTTPLSTQPTGCPHAG